MKTWCGYSLEAPQWGTPKEYPYNMFWCRNKKRNVWRALLSSYDNRPVPIHAIYMYVYTAIYTLTHSMLGTIMQTLWNIFSYFPLGDNLHDITKTLLYNFDPVKPHFYIIILEFTGVYIIFLISAQNIDCGYSLEPPRSHRGGSNEYPQSMFWAEIRKKSEFFIWKFSVFGGKIFSIFE